MLYRKSEMIIALVASLFFAIATPAIVESQELTHDQVAHRLRGVGAHIEYKLLKRNMEHFYDVGLSKVGWDELPIWNGTNDDFALLGKLQKIRRLSILYMDVDDALLASVLQSNPDIEHFTFLGGSPSKKSLAALGQLSKLREVKLFSSKINGMEGLAANKSIRKLQLFYGPESRVPKHVLGRCFSLPRLTNLSLIGQKIEVNELTAIIPNKTIQRMRLLSSEPIRHEELVLLLEKGTALRQLEIHASVSDDAKASFIESAERRGLKIKFISTKAPNDDRRSVP